MMKIKNIFKITICSICILCSFGQLYGQDNLSKHEVSVGGGLGLSTLKFDVQNGTHKSKMGENFGLGYTYHINENIGLKTGLEIAFYSSEAKLNNFKDSYKTIDAAGIFTFNTAVNDYKEKQCATYLNIPLMGQYQLPVFAENQFYVAVGVTVGIPLNGKFKTSNGDFKTTGSQFEYIENPPTIENNAGLGFYSFKGRKIDETLKFDLAIMLSVETGLKWKLCSNMGLYTGIYCNYGLNDIRKGDKNQKFLIYEPPYNNVKAENFQQNSILKSQVTDNLHTQSMTGKVKIVDVGLKIKLGFTLP